MPRRNPIRRRRRAAATARATPLPDGAPRAEYGVLAVCAIAGLGLAGAGIVRVVRAALGLKRRLDAYADLPLRVDVALAQRRIALAERRIATVPVLVSRADGAVRSIAVARSRVMTMAATVVRVIRRPRASR